MPIERRLRTGGDPRALTDYAVLHEEVNKLNHPARPDVNWSKVEQLCLSLFQQNGIDLQTAAWYTQARAQRVGLSGLNEGLAIVEALISRQWVGMWPEPVHARIEILTGLSQRLQHQLRVMALEYRDLPQIHQAEKCIEALCAALRRLELKHISQLSALSLFMHGAAVRLENRYAATDTTLVLPAPATHPAGEWPAGARETWVYAPRGEPVAPRVIISPAPRAKRPIQWIGFAAGMLVTVLAGGGMMVGVNAFYHPPAREQLMATLRVLPKPLSAPALETLKNHEPGMLNREATQLIAATRQQIHRLAKLSPRWAQDTGTQLAHQTRILWPDNPAAKRLTQEWAEQFTANATPLEKLDGWHCANTQLQQLADKLNGLDEKRGKYMTVSQLKSSVFAIQQALDRSPPLEESLRKLAEARQRENAISPRLLMQLDSQFVQLLNRYALLASPREPVG